MERGEGALVPLTREAAGGGLTPAEAVRRATGLTLGAAGLAVSLARAILQAPRPGGSGIGAVGPSEASTPLRRLPVAMLGLGLEAQRRSLDAAAALAGRLSPPLRAAARPAAAPLAAVWRRLDLDGWAERGLAEQRRNRQAAAATARALVGAVAAAVLDEVDLDGVVARVDLDGVVARVDLDRIVDRLDLDQIAGRIDVDAVAARIDVDAVVARVDLPVLVEQVMDELDLGELIRESSGTMATETIDTLRVQGMRADRLLSQVVDRVLRRRAERQT